ncbi:MAG: hypothetical protein KGQ41_05090 [Alphaproteobacteria bacterium]|nr:hypothetical protein [Alphaproteobacteria bacterium]
MMPAMAIHQATAQSIFNHHAPHDARFMADEAARNEWRANTGFCMWDAAALMAEGLPADTAVEFLFRVKDKRNTIQMRIKREGAFEHMALIDFKAQEFFDGSTWVLEPHRNKGYGAHFVAAKARLAQYIPIKRSAFKAGMHLGASTWAKFWPAVDPMCERAIGCEIKSRMKMLEAYLKKMNRPPVPDALLREVEFRTDKMLANEMGYADLGIIAAMRHDLSDYGPDLANMIGSHEAMFMREEVLSPKFTLGRFLLCFQMYDAHLDLRSKRTLKRIEALTGRTVTQPMQSAAYLSSQPSRTVRLP